MLVTSNYVHVKDIPNVKYLLNCSHEWTIDDVDKAHSGVSIDSLNRFEVFLYIKKRLKGELYWYALRNAYIDSDDLFIYNYEVRRAFNKRQPQKLKLMTNDEIDYLEKLPEKLTIYRGMTETELESGNFGVSWTLKKERAEFFANIYVRNTATNHLKKVVHQIIIKKSKVIAFFNDRQEFEIIYLHPKTRIKKSKNR